jgi:hypothetical protein
MKKILFFSILFGCLLVAHYKWPFEMVYLQQAQVKINERKEDVELGARDVIANNQSKAISTSESVIKLQEPQKTLSWAEKLNQCLGPDSIFQNSSENLNQMADLYEKIHSSFGNPKEDSLVLEETILKWTDGEPRTLRWEPSKEYKGMGDLFWYAKDKEGISESLELPEDLETPVSVEDYDRLIREGQMLNQIQSRFLKYDGGLDVGLMLNNNELSGISLEYNQKEIHCQEKADKSVDCECLSSPESRKE